jgi:hypothetical protein
MRISAHPAPVGFISEAAPERLAGKLNKIMNERTASAIGFLTRRPAEDASSMGGAGS